MLHSSLLRVGAGQGRSMLQSRRLGSEGSSGRIFNSEIRNRPGGFITRTDPVVVHETETSKTTAHVVNIPYKTMHVMADLAPEGKAQIDQNDEYVLFSIKIDANGQIFVKPDFNGEKPPYRVETQNELREVYEYTVEHCSVQMTSDQREQEFKSFNEASLIEGCLYNRHALYLASQVGSGFETMPEPGVLRMNIFGEIVSAKGFDYDGLYVHFFLDLPEKWRPTDDPVLSGVTQTCMTKLEGEDYVAHFSFPFDFSLIYQEDDDCDDFICWPTLFVEVLSLDSWERFRTEGYAYITIPNKAGSYCMEVNTWRPIGNGTGPEMRRFFIGGSPELEDPTYPQKPAMADDKVLSKYFFRTAASGSVNVKFHIMQQCQSFMDSKAKKTRHTRTILDRLGGMNALDSLAQVMACGVDKTGFLAWSSEIQAAKESVLFPLSNAIHTGPIDKKLLDKEAVPEHNLAPCLEEGSNGHRGIMKFLCLCKQTLHGLTTHYKVFFTTKHKMHCHENEYIESF
ncbi:Meckel syndrome type 1 protein [Stylophora pistillata]|uniref:Meckel syndrome type 1 protein n=1 Tax=Stylophora pistillata TaxID=50429 RepID=A0A2B4RZ81_STYPI|nr:Meckel syndrome type 1 protein [Stylophora pistillata]